MKQILKIQVVNSDVMKKIIILLIVLLISSTAYADKKSNTINLTIKITNIIPKSGNIIVKVCADEEEFKGEKGVSHGFFFPADSKVITKTIRLPKGNYGIKVSQDENKNKVLDRGPSGHPIERFGYSNNFFGRFAEEPPFEKIVTDLTMDKKVITINLR